MAEIKDFLNSSYNTYLIMIPLLGIIIKAISLTRFNSFERLFISEEKRILSIISVFFISFLMYCALFALLFLSETNPKTINLTEFLFGICILSGIVMVICFVLSFMIAFLISFLFYKKFFL